MPTLTTETALTILIDWLRDNIDSGTNIIFDNDEENTDSTMLLSHAEQALNDVRDLHHLQLQQRARTE
ncbi:MULTISPECIES: DUF957 domain-containing protein [Serratia]|uniref:DUF957 domain-containing protein n=1 Tax=Serratia TaxID=613 RepID=UPI0008A8F9F3|nr:DUF957 domain-containing protein [Serratia marcescens]APS36945.1 hypothetical protein RN42_25280 [Serratia marcescens]OHT35110.1 hypothetical protein BGV45_11725 [Serratia marcescens]OHT36326.1 hypothetical protein BGV46_11715 [Serratia marcescens]